MSGGPSVPIVLLTGPPGAGKSTVGRLVAEAFERSVHIEADVVRESIVGGFVTPSADMFHDEGIGQFALQREIVIHWALRKAHAGYVPVIDDAPIPPDGHFEQQYAPLPTLGWLDELDPELWYTVDSTDLTIEESAALIVAHLLGGDGPRD